MVTSAVQGAPSPVARAPPSNSSDQGSTGLSGRGTPKASAVAPQLRAATLRAPEQSRTAPRIVRQTTTMAAPVAPRQASKRP